MAIANTNIFGNHLDKDINRIFFDEYNGLSTEYDKIFKVEDAPPGNHYTEAELTPLGSLRTINQGGGVTFDDPVEGHKKTVYYTKYGLGFQITQEMIKDDLTGNFKRMPMKLAKSARDKIEVEAFDLFNNGFSATYHTCWDAGAIFTSHTTLKSGDTIDNDPTASSLTETTLMAAFEYFDTLVDEAGYPMLVRPKTLLVPTELRAQAERLLRTTGVVGSVNNDINLVGPSGIFNPGLMVGHYLTDTNAWFVLSDISDFRLMFKERASMESSDDFFTGNALFKAIMRFTAFCMDYKGSYGNEGA